MEGPPNIAALHFATVRRHLAALGRLEATTAAGQEQRDEAKAALPDRYEIGLAVDVRSRPRSPLEHFNKPEMRFRLNAVGSQAGLRACR